LEGLIQWDQDDGSAIKETSSFTKSSIEAEKDEEVALKLTLDDELQSLEPETAERIQQVL
jgi:hypothetical protein